MKLFLFLVVLSLTSTHVMAKPKMHYGDVKFTLIEPTADNFGWERQSKLTPIYPISLAKKGIAGCSVLQINIGDNGKAAIDNTISVIPHKTLENASKTLIKSWQWQRVNANGPDTATVRVDYCLGGASLEEAQQLCEKQSRLRCAE